MKVKYKTLIREAQQRNKQRITAAQEYVNTKLREAEIFTGDTDHETVSI